MKEFKGTKGPWEVVGAGFNDEGTYYTLNIDWISKDNANLIEAAPDLLEALQKLVMELEITLRVGYERIIDLGGSCDEPQAMIDGHPEIARAKEAISKALGEKILGVNLEDK